MMNLCYIYINRIGNMKTLYTAVYNTIIFQAIKEKVKEQVSSNIGAVSTAGSSSQMS